MTLDQWQQQVHDSGRVIKDELVKLVQLGQLKDIDVVVKRTHAKDVTTVRGDVSRYVLTGLDVFISTVM